MVNCPNLYVIYTKPLGDLRRKHDNATTFTLYLAFKPKDDVAQFETLTDIESCLKYIESWMACNMIKLNVDKTYRGHAILL